MRVVPKSIPSFIASWSHASQVLWIDAVRLAGGPNGGERIVGAEGHLSVNLGERDGAIQALEMADGFKADRFGSHPVSAGVGAEEFGNDLRRQGQNVFFH